MKIELKVVVKDEVLELIKNGRVFPIKEVSDFPTDEEIKEVGERITKYEKGRDTFLKAVKIMGDAVLGQIPQDCRKVELSLIAEVE